MRERDTFIWDEKKILDIFNYHEKDIEMSLYEYKLISTLKNMRSTLIIKFKDLSILVMFI